MEHCKNPWKRECTNTDVEVYILFKGEKRPICRHCWGKLSEQEFEW
jgi:hypothetical protein